MPDLNIVVLVKGVPDFREGQVQFKDDHTLNRGKTPTVLNPNDHMALEAAREVQVKHGGTVSVMSMGPPNYKKILHEAMTICGDHGYLLSDIKFAAADTWATAHALQAGINKVGDIDMVFAGFKSADGETGQTGPQTALLLDMPVITHVTSLRLHPEEGRLEATRVAAETIEHCEAPLRTFIVTDPGFTSSYKRASQRLGLLQHMEGAKKRLEDPDAHTTTWTAEDIGVDENRIGLKGSPTIVRGVDPIPASPTERTARVMDTSDASIEELAKIIITKLKE
jgi:electron transfer flavoprotein beta subunit